MGTKKSIFERMETFTVSDSKASASRFEIVEGSKELFSKSDIKLITECTLLVCKSELYKTTSMKLLVKAKIKGKVKGVFIKLDGKSYKRYKDNHNCSVDPSKVCIYQLHDPEEEYGSEENDYTWTVCRIKEGAITGTRGNDDEDFFKE